MDKRIVLEYINSSFSSDKARTLSIVYPGTLELIEELVTVDYFRIDTGTWHQPIIPQLSAD